MLRGLLVLLAALGIGAAASASPPAERSSTAAAVTPTAGRTLTKQDTEAWLDGYMPYALASADIPGAVVTIVKDGQVVAEKGYGFADVARRVPVDPQRTLFRAGSVSKLFTWTAVMQLVEQGHIDLDADVNRYLDFHIPPYDGRPVTMRNLMTHTGGFEEARRGIATTEQGPLTPLGASLRDNIPARIVPPGTKPAYSNFGAALAGYIVERVSGEPFERYVARHILDPLGMRRTTFIQPLPADLAAEASRGYLGDGVTPGPFETVLWRPAGAISTTGDDMARFMIAHLQDGSFTNKRILEARTAQAMHDTPAASGVPWLGRMRLGFYDVGINGRRVIGHHGDTVLFHAMVALFLDDHVGIFMAFNGSGKMGAVSVVREQLFERFADRYLPGPASQDKWLNAATARAHAGMFASAYENSRGYFTSFLTFTRLLDPARMIVRPDGTISLSGYKGPDGEPKRFRESSPFHWREVDGHDRLAAVVRDGRITQVAASGFAPIMVFDAVPGWRSPFLLRVLFMFSAAALLLTILAWPVGVLIRRRYGIAGSSDPYQTNARLLVRVATSVTLAALGGWGWLLVRIMTPTGIYVLARDRNAILGIQALTLVGCVGALVAAAYRLFVAWHTQERWFVRVGCAVLFVAVAGLLYTAVVSRMVSFSTAF